MKKLSIVMMMLMMSFSMTYAASFTEPDFSNTKIGIGKMKETNNKIEDMKVADCSVTLKGKLDLGPVEAEVSCTTTAPTCNEASVQAASCLKAAMNIIKTIIY